MVALRHDVNADDGSVVDDALFGLIAADLETQGFSVRPGALPESLVHAMLCCQQALNDQQFVNAGIGRGDDFVKTEFVRTDEICWITGETPEGRQWVDWTSRLQAFLNRRLFLGLFSFESHFAHYAPGAYYKRHYDAFRGETNRVLSVVAYLNAGWRIDDGGELVLYKDDHDREGLHVVPLMGTIVVFLSEEFPHEVLPATRDRHSIAGWFRVNTSIDNKIDPPQ